LARRVCRGLDFMVDAGITDTVSKAPQAA
jgi:hypothetical protein